MWRKDKQTIDKIISITVNGLENHKYKNALDKINQLLTTESLKKELTKKIK
jgi:hypothetical protein